MIVFKTLAKELLVAKLAIESDWRAAHGLRIMRIPKRGECLFLSLTNNSIFTWFILR
jgi:hypothetical protein